MDIHILLRQSQQHTPTLSCALYLKTQLAKHHNSLGQALPQVVHFDARSPKPHQNLTKTLPKPRQNFAKTLPKPHQNIAKTSPKPH